MRLTLVAMLLAVVAPGCFDNGCFTQTQPVWRDPSFWAAASSAPGVTWMPWRIPPTIHLAGDDAAAWPDADVERIALHDQGESFTLRVHGQTAWFDARVRNATIATAGADSRSWTGRWAVSATPWRVFTYRDLPDNWTAITAEWSDNVTLRPLPPGWDRGLAPGYEPGSYFGGNITLNLGAWRGVFPEETPNGNTQQVYVDGRGQVWGPQFPGHAVARLRNDTALLFKRAGLPPPPPTVSTVQRTGCL